MNKVILSIITAAVCGFSAYASDEIRIGFCGDMEAGYGDAGASVTPWVILSPEKIGPYEGCSITALRIGLNSKATNVSVYFREDPKSSTNLYTQKAGTLTEGWQTITLETPYEIKADTQLAIGYKASFGKSGGAAYTNGKIDAAANVYVNTTSTWTEINGAFCIEAIVSGDNLPVDEMGLISLTDGTKPYDSDETLLSAKVENLGANDITSLTYSIAVDGGTPIETTKEIEIPVNGKAGFDVSVPSVGVGRHEVVMTILKVNGKDDKFTDNNVAKATVTERDVTFRRKVVVEEGTGTWCGWCPRGMVGLEMMAEKYPDQFIGIAVHSNDIMTAPGFETVLGKFPTFPNSITDRHYLGDPYDDIERLVLNEIKQDCHVAYSLVVWYEDGKVKTRSRVLSDVETKGSSLNFAFTVVENNVCVEGDPNYCQENSYSGSSTEMGGWQELPRLVPNVKFQDVARGIFPTYDGEPMLTGDLAENEEMYFDYEFELPSNVLNPENVYIVGLALDSGNGFVLNADKAKLTGGSLVNAVTSDRVVEEDTYDLTGKVVGNAYRGMIVKVEKFSDGTVKATKMIR